MAPHYSRPEMPVPLSWPEGEAYADRGDETLPVVAHSDIFLDPGLQTLIALAMENNRDLRIAAANIAMARGQLRIARGGQLPELVAGVSAEYRDDGGGGRELYALRGGISGFELDFFGRLANASVAEQERLLARISAADTVRTALIADIAAAWAIYAADRDLLSIAEETAANARRSVDLTRLRLEGGIAPRTDLRQAEQVLAAAEGDLAILKAALAQDENILRLLVGASFDPALLAGSVAEASEGIAALPAGTASEVLLRRPDIVEAEYLLRAAYADIGVARARLFPVITLSGLLSAVSGALGGLFADGSIGVSAGADASYAIFDGGRRRAGVAVSEAQRDAALAAYERAIQTAFREVADALAIQGTIDERLEAARRNVEAATDTASLTEARYREGVDSFLANLVAQRSLYSARREETAVELSALLNRIALYRALGGSAETR